MQVWDIARRGYVVGTEHLNFLVDSRAASVLARQVYFFLLTEERVD